MDRVRYQAQTFNNDIRKDLSKNLDVVCFVMAVEVDRLVQENTNLKEEVKEVANMKVDRLNYEKQIGDLMARLNQLMNENAALKRDNDNLNNLLRDAKNQLGALQAQLKQKDGELSDAKNQLDDITGGDMDFNIDDLRKKAELLDSMTNGGSIEDMQDELDELRRKAELYDHHIELLNGKELEDVLRDLEDLEKLKKQCKEQQQKIIELQKELDALRKKSKELDDMKRKLGDDPSKEVDKLRRSAKEQDDLKKKLNDALAQIELLKKQLAEKTNECQQLDEHLQIAQQYLFEKDSRIAELERQLQQLLDLQNRIPILEREIENLKQQLRDKIGQLEDKDRTIDRLMRELDDLKNQMKRLQDQIQQLERDKMNAQAQLNQVQGQLMRAQDSFNATQQQLQQLNDIANQQGDEKEKYEDEIDALQNQLDKLQDQIQELNDEIARLKQKIAEQDVEIESLKQIVTQKNIRIKELEDLLNNANKALKENETKLKKYMPKDGTSENDPKNSTARKLLGQQATQSGLDAQLPNGLTKEQDYLLKYLLLAAENERLNNVLVDLIRKYEQAVRDLERLEQDNISLRDKNNQLTNQLNDTKSQLDEVKRQPNNSDELERLRKQLYEYENKLALLSMEISRLKQSSSLSQSGYNRMEQIMQPQVTQNDYQSNEEIERLKRIIEDQLCLIVLMSAEVEQLRLNEPKKLNASSQSGKVTPSDNVQVGYGRSTVY